MTYLRKGNCKGAGALDRNKSSLTYGAVVVWLSRRGTVSGGNTHTSKKWHRKAWQARYRAKNMARNGSASP